MHSHAMTRRDTASRHLLIHWFRVRIPGGSPLRFTCRINNSGRSACQPRWPAFASYPLAYPKQIQNTVPAHCSPRRDSACCFLFIAYERNEVNELSRCNDRRRCLRRLRSDFVFSVRKRRSKRKITPFRDLINIFALLALTRLGCTVYLRRGQSSPRTIRRFVSAVFHGGVMTDQLNNQRRVHCEHVAHMANPRGELYVCTDSLHSANYNQAARRSLGSGTTPERTTRQEPRIHQLGMIARSFACATWLMCPRLFLRTRKGGEDCGRSEAGTYR
jgi:hypothetical protein